MTSRPGQRRAALALLAAGAAGCAVPTREARMPGVERSFVAVLSGQMPPPLDRVSRHSWIVTHHRGARRYQRFEMGGGDPRDPYDDFASGDVMLHGVVEMSEAELVETEACLGRAKQEYYRRFPDYFPIPGPNSNTLVALLLRRCDLRVELPSTAIGRDYVGKAGAQITEAGTGVQVGVLPLGLRLGLKEGVEVQLFGLPLGVHFWPPGVSVPVNPGRIGVDLDGHQRRPFRWPSHQPTMPDLAVGTLAIFARGSAAARPELASGLRGDAVVGMTARGVYGGRTGLGLGLDLEAGGTSPAGFTGAARLFPLGLGRALGPTAFAAVFSGVGVSGATGTVAAAFELPQEARLEIDLERRAHLALVAQGRFTFGRSPGPRAPWLFDETSLALRAGFGDLQANRPFSFASRMFFGFERRTLEGSPFVGLVVGSEIGASVSCGKSKSKSKRARRESPWDSPCD